MVSAVSVDENDGIMLISDKGTLIRTAISQIPTLGRNTQGVKVITPKEGEKLIEGVRIPPEEEKNNEEMEFFGRSCCYSAICFAGSSG